MKVLILAIGHTENVLSLAYHLSERVDLTVIFEMPGDKYTSGILNMDISGLKTGLTMNQEKINKVFPGDIIKFINGRFRLGILKSHDNKLFKDKYLRNFRTVYRSVKKINAIRFDVVHINGLSGFIFYYYHFIKNRTLFWTLHDFKPHTGEGRVFTKRKNKYLAGLKRIKVVQHYKYLQEAIVKEFALNPDKVIQLYSGPFTIYKAFSEKKLNGLGDYVLFFGRISKYKGIDKLLEAYLKIDNPSKKLVIAGRGNYWFDVKKVNSNDNIVFINRYIETAELNYLIRNSAFVVVPYTDATHSAVIATSYAFHKPVLASNVDGLSEAVQQDVTGKLFDWHRAENLKENLQLLMENPAILDGFSRNIANGMPPALNWDNIVQEYIKVYSDYIH